MEIRSLNTFADLSLSDLPKATQEVWGRAGLQPRSSSPRLMPEALRPSFLFHERLTRSLLVLHSRWHSSLGLHVRSMYQCAVGRHYAVGCAVLWRRCEIKILTMPGQWRCHEKRGVLPCFWETLLGYLHSTCLKFPLKLRLGAIAFFISWMKLFSVAGGGDQLDLQYSPLVASLQQWTQWWL